MRCHCIVESQFLQMKAHKELISSFVDRSYRCAPLDPSTMVKDVLAYVSSVLLGLHLLFGAFCTPHITCFSLIYQPHHLLRSDCGVRDLYRTVRFAFESFSAPRVVFPGIAFIVAEVAYTCSFFGFNRYYNCSCYTSGKELLGSGCCSTP
jgi:hypothetical protein